jgi:hypothetical protein
MDKAKWGKASKEIEEISSSMSDYVRELNQEGKEDK